MVEHFGSVPRRQDADGHALDGHWYVKGGEPSTCDDAWCADMIVYRVALRKFGATAKDALSGVSGYSADGRWHSQRRFLDYTSQSRSLATLERLVHYKRF